MPEACRTGGFHGRRPDGRLFESLTRGSCRHLRSEPMGKLSGKVALVTGASRGIGAAIARRLAADGAKVVVNYATSGQAAEQVVAQIKQAGGEAVAVRADVGKPAEILGLIAAAAK